LFAGTVQGSQLWIFRFSNFDVDEYEHFEQVEVRNHPEYVAGCQGTCNARYTKYSPYYFGFPEWGFELDHQGSHLWHSRDLTFIGTSRGRGIAHLTPADYVPYFKERNVGFGGPVEQALLRRRRLYDERDSSL
jgi:hypothetical protein